MLKEIKAFFATHPDKKSFQALLGQRYPEYSPESRLVMRGYETAKEIFAEDRRLSGERYFEHLRRVTLVLMYYRIYDANTLCAALHHDTGEDKQRWPESRLALQFNPEVAEIVGWTSKGKLEDFNGDKDARNHAFFSTFIIMPRPPALIKIADRVENLMDAWEEERSVRYRQEKFAETRAHYLPLAERQVFMIHELEEAMRKPV